MAVPEDCIERYEKSDAIRWLRANPAVMEYIESLDDDEVPVSTA